MPKIWTTCCPIREICIKPEGHKRHVSPRSDSRSAHFSEGVEVRGLTQSASSEPRAIRNCATRCEHEIEEARSLRFTPASLFLDHVPVKSGRQRHNGQPVEGRGAVAQRMIALPKAYGATVVLPDKIGFAVIVHVANADQMPTGAGIEVERVDCGDRRNLSPTEQDAAAVLEDDIGQAATVKVAVPLTAQDVHARGGPRWCRT